MSLFYFLLVYVNCAVQVQDSLYATVTILPVTDTLTIDARNDYVRQALFLNPADTTLFLFAEKTVQYAHKLAYEKGVLLAYERMGLVQQYSYSNPFKALECYH